MDCGPTCVAIIGKYYGRSYEIEKLRRLAELGKEGVNLLGLSNAAEKIGFRTQGVQLSLKQLQDAILPTILHWNQYHFVVLYQVKRGKYYIAEPAVGMLVLTEKEFSQQWISTVTAGEPSGVALIMQPGPEFYENHEDENSRRSRRKRLGSVIRYLLPYKKLVAQLILGLLVGSLLQLVLPFLTQSVVDRGVNTGNIGFIKLVLIAQLALLAGRLLTDFARGWTLYYISSRINISILTDFLIKLVKLPISYFDSKKTGDILQRMNDHRRIQDFLTGTSLQTLFSLFNLLVFSVVLAKYNLAIFSVFLMASIVYVLWIFIFLKKRRLLDYKQFGVASAEQGKLIQIIQGMTEIKLQGCEKAKRWEWERLQAKYLNLGMRSLSLNQWQQTGAFLVNEGKNIFITFMAASAVIGGSLTIGEMLAIQYIIGQLNSPVEQMISFVQNWQLARISFDRLNEIHSQEDEEPAGKIYNDVPDDHTMTLKNVSFTYPGAGNDPALKNVTLTIPHGKTTAIIGASGSGKTTLLKLLLQFYSPEKGSIRLGGSELSDISPGSWRKNIGVVMQESYVFSESIAANIAGDVESVDGHRLRMAAQAANALEFIETLPLGFNTNIGAEGTGISLGQRQRILIARAIYKNPDFLFFDEATNSLDANNEKAIMKNLHEFTRGRTVVVIAHRLSTVKNADQIVVLDKGRITEIGTHAELSALRGEYFTLVKNQLELGN